MSLLNFVTDDIGIIPILNPKPYYLTSTTNTISAKSDIGPTMNIHKFINQELEFDLNNPYILVEEEIISMFDERDEVVDNEPTKELDNV